MIRDNVLSEVEKYTLSMINSKKIDNNGMEASQIAYELGLDRSNVSRELNELWKNGELIKIQGRPVLYVAYKLLKVEYPNCYIPTTISKSASLMSYLGKVSVKEKNEFVHVSNPIDVIVGANGSLKADVQKAIAAVTYPPYGIPLLITGHAGTGKRKFAEYIYYYLIQQQLRDSNARFIIVNCADYINDDELFRKILLGQARTATSKGAKGLIESSEKGIIYFDDIQKLSAKSLNLVLSMISGGSFSRYGETQERPLEASIIASITTDTAAELPVSLSEYFSATVNLPDFSMRNAFEKIETILSFFSREAFNTRKALLIQKSVIYLFAVSDYRENDTQLRNEIKAACAKAFLERNTADDSVVISFVHLSNELLANKKQDSFLSRALDMYDKKTIVFDSQGNCEAWDYFHNIQDRYNSLNMQQFINQFNINISAIEDPDEFIHSTIDILIKLDNEHYFELQSRVKESYLNCIISVLSKDQLYRGIMENYRILYGLALLMENAAGNSRPSEPLNETEISMVHQREYQTVLQIAEKINEKNLGSLDRPALDFFSRFLSITNRILGLSTVSILVICQGEHIASELCSNCYELAEKNHVSLEAINYHSDMQFNDLLKLSYLALNRLNNGSGVLVLVDSYPLNGIEEQLRKECDVEIKVIPSVSLDMLMEAIESSGQLQNLSHFTLEPYRIAQQKKETETDTDQLINMLINDVLSKTVLFVNPRRASEALMYSLHLILDKINMSYNKPIAVKFVSHGMHMIERIVRGDSLLFYQLKQFTEKHFELMNTISQSLVSVQNIFDIHIPDSEIAFLTEIFLEEMQ
ncbi:MAG: sigma 54-interacting transcriptional regulator [Erysipelotrichaceae bacterium]|nr:sigma 54-interacting transcriptional regulator [Erysipelotrichaceae bacterium]